MKRISAGHYEAVISGKHVEIYRVLHRTTVGWNLRIDGTVVEDWLVTKQQAVEAAQRLIK